VNRLQVIDLIAVIKRSYPSYDSSAANVDHLAKYLADFPYEGALENVDKHILTERFPPAIADIRGKLGDQMDSQRSKEQARAYFAQLDEWAATSSPPPEGYWERVRGIIKGEENA
jgi:hypothetical protein